MRAAFRPGYRASGGGAIGIERYLVTGGAGFLGINMIRRLIGSGQEVVSLDLAPFDYADVKDSVRIVRGDIRNAGDVRSAMEGVHVVIHAAAALPLYKPADIYSTDVDGTRMVLDAALCAKVRRAVHISSTAVYGIPDHHPLLCTPSCRMAPSPRRVTSCPCRRDWPSNRS